MVERTLQLNNQAQGLTLDYHMKATQQEWAEKRRAFETQFMTEENKLAKQFAEQVRVGGGVSIGDTGIASGVGIGATQFAAAGTYVAPAATTAAPVTYAAP